MVKTNFQPEHPLWREINFEPPNFRNEARRMVERNTSKQVKNIENVMMTPNFWMSVDLVMVKIKHALNPHPSKT